MEFEWDDSKAAANLRKHRIPFPFAARVFLDADRLEWVDTRQPYGEPRWITLGLVDGLEIIVAYTMREDALRIISARRALRREREDYWNR